MKSNSNFVYFLSFVITIYGINYCSNKYNTTNNTVSANNITNTISLTNNNIIYKINNKKARKTKDFHSNIYNKNNKTKKSYKVSKKGQKHIKEHESCVLTLYNIKNNKGKYEKYNTIGYGHQLRPGDKYYNRKSISQFEAEKIFESDMRIINESINRLISELSKQFEPSQDFIDGFGSLVFNCGESGVRNSELFKRLKRCRYKNGVINKQDYEYAISAVRNMNITHKGHINRRETEYLLMQGII